MRDGTRTKERIESAARHLFVKQGVNATSIREVSRLAGVSQGAMYNHYVSKEELAYVLFAEGWADMGAHLRRIARDHDGVEARFQAMVGYVLRRFDEDWIWVTYVFLARHENLRRVMRERLPNPYLTFQKVISKAIDDGEIPAQDLALATAMITGVIIQVIDSKILGQIRGRLAARADHVAAASVNLLRAQQGGRR